jgi:hypothetical protein
LCRSTTEKQKNSSAAGFFQQPAIYLVLVIKGCFFLEGFEPNTQNPTPKGAPFYIASANLKCGPLCYLGDRIGVTLALGNNPACPSQLYNCLVFGFWVNGKALAYPGKVLHNLELHF